MWDNRCATHGRTWFPEEQTRLLRRCTVHADGVPVE
jgi:alpha-ketoglutarate-dependent taurine dioxygenase